MLKDVFSLNYFRGRLAHLEALPQLALLGLAAGLAAGSLMVLFRLAIEVPLVWLLGDAENFEQLPASLRFIGPLLGVCLILLCLYLVAPERRRVGVVYVLERLNFHQGYLHGRNAIVQFFSGALAIISGLPAGREGPAIHLGAAVSSLLGQRLQAPNNSIRILVGCGVAAAISASFNTPLAGVLFAMEVVLLEYSINGFLPVMVASVTAALINHAVFSGEIAFIVPELQYRSLYEIPFIMLLGFVLGTLAAAFNKLVLLTHRLQHWPLSVRFLSAGLMAALGAVAVPEIMGIGYDSISSILQGQMLLPTLLLLTLVKLACTAWCFGIGIPMGCIGPILLIGASAGGALGILGGLISPQPIGDMGFYAMLGMGAMMSAALQAPLAALTALLELTHNSNIIFPGMLAIVVANLTCSYVFKQKSVFWSLLAEQGHLPNQSPLTQALSREGVAAVMQRNTPRSSHKVTPAEAQALIELNAPWLLIMREGTPVSLLATSDLRRFLLAEHAPTQEHQEISLLAIPAQRKDLQPIAIQATLKEALDRLNQSGSEALYVRGWSGSIVGTLTYDDLRNYMNQQQNLL